MDLDYLEETATEIVIMLLFFVDNRVWASMP